MAGGGDHSGNRRGEHGAAGVHLVCGRRSGCNGTRDHRYGLYSAVCGVTVVSILVLAITRPFVKKKLTVQKTETNSRALIGKVAKVIQPIDNLQSQGRVMVEDMDWSARSENGEPIDVGEEVLIKEIQGVKLIVEKIY